MSFYGYCFYGVDFFLFMDVMDVVCSENANNTSLVQLGTKALWQPSTGRGNSNVKQMNVQTE